MKLLLTPESSDLRVRNQDTAEEDEHTDKEGVDKRCKDGVGRVSGDELADTGIEEFVEGHLKVDGAGGVRRVAEADDGVPAGQPSKVIR